MPETTNIKSNNLPSALSVISDSDASKKTGIERELYAKNVELDFANEVFFLTREIYSVSLLNLRPATFSERVTSIIREKLQFEIVGIFTFKQKENLLEPLAFAKSERAVSALRRMGFLLKDVKITDASKRPALKDVFDGKTLVTNKISDIWGGLTSEDNLNTIVTSANIKTFLIYPLLTEEKFIGILLFGLHLDYKELPKPEREAMKSFSDIIAIVLDRAYIHRKMDEINQSLVSTNLELLQANEELKTIDETKSAILSNASHHLQNPLQDIVMGASMLVDGSFGAISPEAKKAAAAMFESARHLTITFKMWLKILDFENGRVEYKKELFDLAVLAEKTVDSWMASAKERGLELVFETDNHPPYVINGDPEWIREVIINLVDNALKMTEKGFVRLRLEKFGVEKIQLSVADSGAGIDEETTKRLFQKLEKGKEGWKKDIYGTGMGLYLCKKIIEEGHKGLIWAESQGSGKGATFYVEFPTQ